MDEKREFLASAWRAFWADPPPPPPPPPPQQQQQQQQQPAATDAIFGQITGAIAAIQPSHWIETLICKLFQADPSKMRMRCNGFCCLSLPELMVISLRSSSLCITTVDQRAASTPAELFELLSCMPAFDANFFLTLQYLVSMGWRCSDGSKYGSHLVAYSSHRAHSMYCVTVSCKHIRLACCASTSHTFAPAHSMARCCSRAPPCST